MTTQLETKRNAKICDTVTPQYYIFFFLTVKKETSKHQFIF